MRWIRFGLLAILLPSDWTRDRVSVSRREPRNEWKIVVTDAPASDDVARELCHASATPVSAVLMVLSGFSRVLFFRDYEPCS